MRKYIMLVYNEELGEDGCRLNVTSNTDTFVIGFFGFFPHHMDESLNKFLSEIAVKKIITGDKDLKKFKLDGKYAVEGYNCCDRRTFDVTIILPKAFSSEQSAIDWLNQKLKDSDYINKRDISEIGVMDADALFALFAEEMAYDDKVKTIDDAFKQSIEDLKKQMLANFSHDPDYTYIINSKFDQIRR